MRMGNKVQTNEVPRAGLSISDRATDPGRLLVTQKKIVGSSPRLRTCLQQAIKAAEANKNILLYGETGTGKDLFARVIHDNSPSLQNRFAVLDCRFRDEDSLEALLLGEDDQGRISSGLLSLTEWGTLYLDEISDLSLNCQKTICTLLQQEIGRRLDGRARVKLIAASQQDLEILNKQGRFRSDLLALFQTSRIDLPPLRENPEDILELSRFYLNRFSLWHGITPKTITPEFNAMLLQYPWPGNVRELANTLEQSLLTGRFERTLFPKHLPSHIRVQVTRSSLQQAAVS